MMFCCVIVTRFFNHSPIVQVGHSQSFTTNKTTGDNAIYMPFLVYAGRPVLNNF